MADIIKSPTHLTLELLQQQLITAVSGHHPKAAGHDIIFHLSHRHT